jgi:hypothetical protein
MGPWLSNGLRWCFWWQTWGQFQFKVNIVWTYFFKIGWTLDLKLIQNKFQI